MPFSGCWMGWGLREVFQERELRRHSGGIIFAGRRDFKKPDSQEGGRAVHLPESRGGETLERWRRPGVERFSVSRRKHPFCFVGVGKPLSPERCRMLLALRINVLAKGCSGISLETLKQVIEAFNGNAVARRLAAR